MFSPTAPVHPDRRPGETRGRPRGGAREECCRRRQRRRETAAHGAAGEALSKRLQGKHVVERKNFSGRIVFFLNYLKLVGVFWAEQSGAKLSGAQRAQRSGAHANFQQILHHSIALFTFEIFSTRRSREEIFRPTVPRNRKSSSLTWGQSLRCLPPQKLP
jgi:hypothetical protein